MGENNTGRKTGLQSDEQFDTPELAAEIKGASQTYNQTINLMKATGVDGRKIKRAQDIVRQMSRLEVLLRNFKKTADEARKNLTIKQKIYTKKLEMYYSRLDDYEIAYDEWRRLPPELKAECEKPEEPREPIDPMHDLSGLSESVLGSRAVKEVSDAEDKLLRLRNEFANLFNLDDVRAARLAQMKSQTDLNNKMTGAVNVFFGNMPRPNRTPDEAVLEIAESDEDIEIVEFREGIEYEVQ